MRATRKRLRHSKRFRGRGRRRLRHTRRVQHGGASILHKNPASKIRVFMCANKSKPTLEALMKSLEQHNYSYEVLAFRKPWENLRAKIEYYLEGAKAYEKEAGPDALSIFLDGFDVICVQDSDQVYKKYQSKPRKMPVVFGAEEWCLGNCYKDVLEWYTYHKIRGGRKQVDKDLKEVEYGYEQSAKEPTFMNTGFLIGPVGKVRELYEGILATPYVNDDQYTTGMYVVNHFDKIDLDLEELFVRNKINVKDKLPDEGTSKGPGFLHFPGSRTDEEQAQLLERYRAYMSLDDPPK